MKNADFLIVNRKLLPECFSKVVETRRLLESHAEKDVSSAVRRTGISRSTYYKYKDDVFSLNSEKTGRKAVISMLLSHEIGVLSNVLNTLSSFGGSVIAISQSVPIHNVASVMLTLDVSRLESSVRDVLTGISDIRGVEDARLVLVE